MPGYTRETFELHSMAPDLIPADAPLTAWNNARNVIFKNGESRRSLGDKDTLTNNTLASAPMTMVYVEPFDSGFWVYANDDGIWAHDGTNEWDITPASWNPTAGGMWTSCVINGLAVINNSNETPVWWDGATTSICEPLPDWPANGRAICMRAHKNFLFAIGMVSEGEQRVRWSDAAEAGVIPQEWAPAASNLAGFVDLAPLSSPCVEGATLRDSFLVYKRQSVWSFDFVGGTSVFNARKIFAEHGIADTNALTVGPNDEHLFVGSDGDIMLTDAVQVQSVLDGRAQQTFYEDFANASDLVFSACTVMHDKIGYIIYPAAGTTAGTQALAYDFGSGDIGVRDMPEVTCAARGQELQDVGNKNTWDGSSGTWNDDTSAWNQIITAQSVEDCLIGGAFGFRVVEADDIDAAADTTLEARLEKAGLSFGDAQRRKLVKAIWPKIFGREGDIVTFRIGGQELPDGPTSWGTPVDFEIGSGSPVECWVEGRYLSLQVSSLGGNPWRLGTSDIEFKGLGQW